MTCTHWYILDQQNHGRCKYCGHERDHNPDYDSYNRVMANHSDKDWSARWQNARQATRMGYTDWYLAEKGEAS